MNFDRRPPDSPERSQPGHRGQHSHRNVALCSRGTTRNTLACSGDDRAASASAECRGAHRAKNPKKKGTRNCGVSARLASPCACSKERIVDCLEQSSTLRHRANSTRDCIVRRTRLVSPDARSPVCVCVAACPPQTEELDRQPAGKKHEATEMPRERAKGNQKRTNVRIR